MISCGPSWHKSQAYRIVGALRLSALLCLLIACGWFVARAPAASASGVPLCPNPLPDEHTPTRPAIHLNRTEGPIGTNITVAASGWRPGAQVALHLDGRDPKSGEMYVLMPAMAEGTVARNGTVTLVGLQAPWFACSTLYTNAVTDNFYHFDSQGGTTAYFVLAANDGEASAPVAFNYLPAPTVSVKVGDPDWNRLKVGSTISVSGAGWESGEALTLTLRPSMGSAPSAPMPFSRKVSVTTDAQGGFTATYPLDARLRWNTDALVTAEGIGPRFGTLDAAADIFLMPAIQPTFQADHTLVTPGMALTISGDHWYPGDTLTVKVCDASWGDHGWTLGPNCGKAVNPTLGTATADAQGHIRQQFRIPRDTPLGISMIVTEEFYAGGYGVQPIAVHVVSHLPTWDEIHPRVAALRNRLLGPLPFPVSAILLLGTLAFFGARRWRGRHLAG